MKRWLMVLVWLLALGGLALADGPMTTTPSEDAALLAIESKKYVHLRELAQKMLTDEATKAAVHKIYKRVTEAYTILKDEKKRIKYLADINGPDRARKLRFTEESEAEQKEQQKLATKVAKTPKGEQLYQAALLDMKKSQWDKAYKGIQTATVLEPGNAELKALLADLDKKRKGG